MMKKNSFDTERAWFWIFIAVIVILITFSIEFFFHIPYINSWELASLSWSLVYGIFFFSKAPKNINIGIVALSAAVLSMMVLLIPAKLFVFSKQNSLESIPELVSFFDLMLTFAPLICIIIFTVLDWSVCQSQGSDRILQELKRKSKQFFYFVDVPSLISIALFTIYYFSMQHSKPIVGLKEFFSGATALQLISTNIAFVFIDCTKETDDSLDRVA
jgi:hypothetical protein